MKIKIILIVFILIIGSSFMFSILSSRATTNNNKVYFIGNFINEVCKHELATAKIAKVYFINAGKGQPEKAGMSVSDLDSLRMRLGKAYPKDFEVIQYYDLPEAEQQLNLSTDVLDNIFIVKQQHKKILNVQMNDTKIVSMNP